MSTPILQTKFFIPIPTREFITHPQLLECFDERIQWGSRLILVSAPAEFGKTTLVADWSYQRSMPPDGELKDWRCWLSLDENDNNPARS